ncbi:M1 family metallopeptidase [bacterium]|nr:M1 family metallopeptidase [bacterium]
MKKLLLLPSIMLWISCSSAIEPELMDHDEHSFARPEEVVVTHLDLDIKVDFVKKELTGKAALSIKNKNNFHQLHLDTRGLTIHKITLGKEEKTTAFQMGNPVPDHGQELTVDIESTTDLVNVYYSTGAEADALQWLEPAQTAGKKHPFLFTQSQAILARTWVPCQDSPGIRMTYTAKVECPKELWAVMSAENDTVKNDQGLYTFKMTNPIPAYLLALAVGDLRFQSLGKRSGVYTEPSVMARAAYELGDTEKMIEAAESLYGAYRWGRYDLIVLPPSFPFGGMENPRLTFATPTILAGDRSLVSLVAHELAHSWSGNLVTNATWNDFWLNEGFTCYFERRIDEVVFGKEFAEMEAKLGEHELLEQIKEFGPDSADTRLQINLHGRSPDEAGSDIAYEKGYSFLRLIEETVGREQFDQFLKKYFNTFAFQSMTTKKFVAYLRAELIKGDQELEKKIRIDEWVYQTGLPDNFPKPQSNAFAKVEEQVQNWTKGKPAKELTTANWSTAEWRHFLRNLPKTMTRSQMDELDAAFKFSKTGNSEIIFEWLNHVIVNKYEAGYPQLESFLTTMGRRKFLKPLYQKLAETQDGLQMAKRIYTKARPTYHAVSTSTIDELLKWKT